MNRYILSALLALSACGAPLSPALVRDGNLAIVALQVLGSDAVTLGAPVADVTAVNAAVSAMQVAMTDLQKGTMTSQAFVTLATDEINQAVPQLETDLGANATIKTGTMLLANFVTVMAADLTMANKAPTSQQIDTRSSLDAWVHGQKK